MKYTRHVMLLTGILSILAACSKSEEPNTCIDFATFSFKQTYLRYFQDEDIFFIKGVALEVNKHGREIKVIEDLKGNFSDKSSVFVWGSTGITCDNKGRHDTRIDFITQYHKNDTLIMFIKKAHKRFNGDIESSGDYTVLGNYSSIVKLSKNTVSGYITSCYDDEETMSWEEFQTLINSIK